MDEFIRKQRANMEVGMGNRFFQRLIPLVDSAYHAAIDALPQDGVPLFGRILLIGHKSLLSAAVLIAQLQPEDSVGITRRALEAARLAVAIKLNDQNAQRWTAYQERHDRWLRRQRDEIPRPFVPQFLDVRGDPQYDELGRLLGILSDASVHFTPEFYASLNWEVRRTSATEGEIYLDYFQNNVREIERSFMTLGASHRTILKVLDRCYDGRFQQDDNARRVIAEFWRVGRELSDAFQQEYGPLDAN